MILGRARRGGSGAL